MKDLDLKLLKLGEEAFTHERVLYKYKRTFDELNSRELDELSKQLFALSESNTRSFTINRQNYDSFILGECEHVSSVSTEAQKQLNTDFVEAVNGTFMVVHQDRLIWAGEFKDGLLNGMGAFFTRIDFKESGIYLGGFKNGKFEGDGNLCCNDMSFQGQWRQGKQHGYGTWSDVCGATYEGDWQNGCFHGHGTLTRACGEKYEGDWQKGQRHGEGLFTDFSGSKLFARWKKDQGNCMKK